MRLLGRNHLQKIRGFNTQTDSWLSAWVGEVTAANWKSQPDLIKQFQTVNCLDEGIYLFQVSEICGSIELQIAFPQGIALITAIRKPL